MNLYDEMQRIVVWKAWGISSICRTQLEHKIMAFRKMSGGDSFSKDFEAFFMKHDIETSTHWTSRVCISKHCCNNRTYAQSSKARKIAWTEAVVNAVYTLTNVQWKLCAPLHLKKCGVGSGLALHTCVCSETLHMRWYHTRRGASSIPRESNACFLQILQRYESE